MWTGHRAASADLLEGAQVVEREHRAARAIVRIFERDQRRPWMVHIRLANRRTDLVRIKRTARSLELPDLHTGDR